MTPYATFQTLADQIDAFTKEDLCRFALVLDIRHPFTAARLAKEIKETKEILNSTTEVTATAKE